VYNLYLSVQEYETFSVPEWVFNVLVSKVSWRDCVGRIFNENQSSYYPCTLYINITSNSVPLYISYMPMPIGVPLYRTGCGWVFTKCVMCILYSIVAHFVQMSYPNKSTYYYYFLPIFQDTAPFCEVRFLPSIQFYRFGKKVRIQCQQYSSKYI